MKKGKTHIIARMKTFDQKHKGGKKAVIPSIDIRNCAALQKPFPIRAIEELKNPELEALKLRFVVPELLEE